MDYKVAMAAVFAAALAGPAMAQNATAPKVANNAATNTTQGGPSSPSPSAQPQPSAQNVANQQTGNQQTGNNQQTNNQQTNDQRNGQSTQGQSSTIMTRETVKTDLEHQGFTDVKVTPEAFLVHAKSHDGQQVVMMIEPDSITAVTELPGSGGNTMATGSNANGVNPAKKRDAD